MRTPLRYRSEEILHELFEEINDYLGDKVPDQGRDPEKSEELKAISDEAPPLSPYQRPMLVESDSEEENSIHNESRYQHHLHPQDQDRSPEEDRDDHSLSNDMPSPALSPTRSCSESPETPTNEPRSPSQTCGHCKQEMPVHGLTVETGAGRPLVCASCSSSIKPTKSTSSKLTGIANKVKNTLSPPASKQSSERRRHSLVSGLSILPRMRSFTFDRGNKSEAAAEPQLASRPEPMRHYSQPVQHPPYHGYESYDFQDHHSQQYEAEEYNGEAYHTEDSIVIESPEIYQADPCYSVEEDHYQRAEPYPSMGPSLTSPIYRLKELMDNDSVQNTQDEEPVEDDFVYEDEHPEPVPEQDDYRLPTEIFQEPESTFKGEQSNMGFLTPSRRRGEQHIPLRMEDSRQLVSHQDRMDAYTSAYYHCITARTDLSAWVKKQYAKGPPDTLFEYTPPPRKRPKKLFSLFKTNASKAKESESDATAAARTTAALSTHLSTAHLIQHSRPKPGSDTLTPSSQTDRQSKPGIKPERTQSLPALNTGLPLRSPSPSPLRSPSPAPSTRSTRSSLQPNQAYPEEPASILRKSSSSVSSMHQRYSEPPAEPVSILKNSKTKKRPSSSSSRRQSPQSLLLDVDRLSPLESDGRLSSPRRSMRSRDNSPIHSRDVSPVRLGDLSPVRSPQHYSWDVSPVRSRDISPARSLRTSPIRSRDVTPIETRRVSSIRSRDVSPTVPYPGPMLHGGQNADYSYERRRSPVMFADDRRSRSVSPRPLPDIRGRGFSEEVAMYDDVDDLMYDPGDEYHARMRRRSYQTLSASDVPEPRRSRKHSPMHYGNRRASSHQMLLAPEAMSGKGRRRMTSMGSSPNLHTDFSVYSHSRSPSRASVYSLSNPLYSPLEEAPTYPEFADPMFANEWDEALDDLCEFFQHIDRHILAEYLEAAHGDYYTAKEMCLDDIMTRGL